MGFLDLPDHQADRERSRCAIIPVPYDGTSTWHKGADRGPQAIIDASAELETWDIETAWEPCEHGIATLDQIQHDGGPEQLADRVDGVVADVLSRGQLPIVLGGEHSVSIGAIRAASRKFSDLSVLQIDAHGDTRDEYDGSKFNHACVMARAREWCPIAQVGLRAIDRSELDALDPSRVWFAHDIVGDSRRAWIPDVVDALTNHVYLTIDLDAFDPSLLPATGTPEPGGLGWYDVIALIDAVAARSRIVGFDVVELCPQPGQHASEFIAAKLVHRTLARILKP